MKVEKHKSGFGKIDDINSFSSLDSTLEAQYSDDVVRYARQLRAKHPDQDKFSDTFLLEYALRELNTRYGYQFNIGSPGLDDVPDQAYAGYSYAEILNMYNNGFYVPKEVLAWAKAHQEADVTDYVVVSGEAEVEANAIIQDNVANKSELNQLRAQAKAQIVKSSQSEKDLTTNRKNLDDITENAQSIAKKQETILKNNSLSQMEQMIKDWKNLDGKQKDGKLSSFEESIYKNLTNKISSSAKAFKEIEESANALNQFLDSIESVRSEGFEAQNTAQETMTASFNLSQIRNPISEANYKHTYQTVSSSDPGLLNNILAGVTDDTISYVAEHIGQDLQIFSNETINDINSGIKNDITVFAHEYIAKAQQISTFTQSNISQEGDLINNPKTEEEPSVEPTVAPEGTVEEPSVEPTVAPEETVEEPSVEPTVAPEETVEEPSVEPTVAPEGTVEEPSVEPTVAPEETVEEPSVEPTVALEETVEEPSVEPTVAPEETVEEPSVEPTVAPEETVEEPSVEPTVAPEETVEEPSVEPTVAPEETVEEPSVDPTVAPEETVEEPSVEPTVAPEETVEEPSVEPTVAPEETVEEPSVEPTVAPEETVEEPSVEPTVAPEETVEEPSVEPTVAQNKEVKQTKAMTRSATIGEKATANPTVANDETTEESAVEPTVVSKNTENENILSNEYAAITEETRKISGAVTQSQNITNTQDIFDILRKSTHRLENSVSTIGNIIEKDNKKSLTRTDNKAESTTKTDKNEDVEATRKSSTEGRSSKYGSNDNFQALALATIGANLALNVLGMMLQIRTGGYLRMAASYLVVMGLSIADLFIKEGIVSKTGTLAEKDVQASRKEFNRIDAETKKAVTEHDKNMQTVQGLAAYYKELGDESVNLNYDLLRTQQVQSKQQAKNGEEPAEIALPEQNIYDIEQEGVLTEIDGIAGVDEKNIEKAKKPLAIAQKNIDVSRKSVSDFTKLNNNLSERSDNNHDAGKAIMIHGEVAAGISAVVIGIGIAELSSPFTHALGWQDIKNGAICLAAALGLVAIGASGLITSSKVQESIDSNQEDISKDYLSLEKDKKTYLDVRKALAKAGLEVPHIEVPPKEEPVQTDDTEVSTARENNDEQNKPQLSQNPIQNENEAVRSAASSILVNVSADTTDKADKRLTRFNDEGVVLANRKNRRVNATSAAFSGSSKR